jgi:hypothetical protein
MARGAATPRDREERRGDVAGAACAEEGAAAAGAWGHAAAAPAARAAEPQRHASPCVRAPRQATKAQAALAAAERDALLRENDRIIGHYRKELRAFKWDAREGAKGGLRASS